MTCHSDLIPNVLSLEDDRALISLGYLLTDLNLFQYFEWNSAAIPGLLVIFALIILSALVSGSEVAFFSLSQGQISELDMKQTKAQRISNFLSQPEKLLGTILVGNNLFIPFFV